MNLLVVLGMGAGVPLHQRRRMSAATHAFARLSVRACRRLHSLLDPAQLSPPLFHSAKGWRRYEESRMAASTKARLLALWISAYEERGGGTLMRSHVPKSNGGHLAVAGIQSQSREKATASWHDFGYNYWSAQLRCYFPCLSSMSARQATSIW